MDHGGRVVVGIDGSAGSRAALAYALRDAARRGATVEAVRAFAQPDDPGVEYWAPLYGPRPIPVEQVRAAVRRDAERIVAEITEELRATTGVPPVTVHVAPGGAADVLLHAAQGAELLVVGSRGRGGFRSTLLGSVSLACALHSPCPVTVVHLPPDRGTRGAVAAEVAHAAG